jgi:hypothetical protein
MKIKIIDDQSNSTYSSAPSSFRLKEYQGWEPNCSSVTDAELAQTILGRWPMQNNQVHINYVFSLSSYFEIFVTRVKGYKISDVDANIEANFREAVREGLKSISEKNNGLFVFHEVSRSFETDFSPFFRGIYLAQTADESHFAEDHSYAFTIMSFDNNGYLRTPQIHLPRDDNYTPRNYSSTYNYAKSAIVHEVYHALGSMHLQDFPEILEKLRNTWHGVMCSIMAYPELVETPISSCSYACYPPYPVDPGPLDTRSMDIVYNGNFFDNHNFNIYKLQGYTKNVTGLFTFMFLLVCIYRSADEMLSLLAIKKDKPFIPQKFINFALDLNLAVVLVELGAPDYISIGFCLAAATRLLPDRALKSLPYYDRRPDRPIFQDGYYHLRFLALLCAINEGLSPLFIIQMVLLIGLVDYPNQYKISVGWLLAAAGNFFLQAIGKKVLGNIPVIEDLQAEVARLELESIELVTYNIQTGADDNYSYVAPPVVSEVKSEEQKQSSNQHRFYHSSLVTRLSGSIQGNPFTQLHEHQDEEFTDFMSGPAAPGEAQASAIELQEVRPQAANSAIQRLGFYNSRALAVRLSGALKRRQFAQLEEIKDEEIIEFDSREADTEIARNPSL